jgi:ketosteroid isomerase-like protein
MSQENVDKTLAFIAAYNRRDFDAAIEHFAPDVEWVLPEKEGYDSCVGPDQIVLFWKGLDETFEELELLPQECVDAGDRVAVRLRHAVRGRGSGLELDNELYHQVTTFRDGQIARFDYVETWPEALAIAGIEAEA